MYWGNMVVIYVKTDMAYLKEEKYTGFGIDKCCQ